MSNTTISASDHKNVPKMCASCKVSYNVCDDWKCKKDSDCIYNKKCPRCAEISNCEVQYEFVKCSTCTNDVKVCKNPNCPDDDDKKGKRICPHKSCELCTMIDTAVNIPGWIKCTECDTSYNSKQDRSCPLCRRLVIEKEEILQKIAEEVYYE